MIYGAINFTIKSLQKPHYQVKVLKNIEENLKTLTEKSDDAKRIDDVKST